MYLLSWGIFLRSTKKEKQRKIKLRDRTTIETMKITVSEVFQILLISSILKLMSVQIMNSNMVSRKNLITVCLNAVESRNLSRQANLLHFTNAKISTKIPLNSR